MISVRRYIILIASSAFSFFLLADAFGYTESSEESSSSWEMVEARSEGLGLLMTLDVGVKESVPTIVVFSMKNITESPVKVWGRLSSKDFSKNITLRQGDITWRARELPSLATPALGPGETVQPPMSETIEPGESVSWRYELEELIEDYQAYLDQDHYGGLIVRGDYIYEVSEESSEYSEVVAADAISVVWRMEAQGISQPSR